MSVIYETRGRAREYCSLAVNLYSGCGHRCVYCYGADVTHQDKQTFEMNPRPRPRILERLKRDAQQLQKRCNTRPVLMCFVTDPYQPVEKEHQIADRAIDILHEHGSRVILLTKGGYRAMSGIERLRIGDEFAVTLTCATAEKSLKWEPGAALPIERMDTLREAYKRGIFTWVSLEPILDLEETLELIRLTHEFVDLFKVGKLNYHEHRFQIDWREVVRRVVGLCDSLNQPYLLKKDLASYEQQC